MIAIHICGYLLLQLVANLLFKWGSSGSGCYWMGFILGTAQEYEDRHAGQGYDDSSL